MLLGICSNGLTRGAGPRGVRHEVQMQRFPTGYVLRAP